MGDELLTPRWTQLDYHVEQIRMEESATRFVVGAAGRRSGKTERAKRKLIKCSMDPPIAGANFAACAPTRDQARRIYWEDLKDLAPRRWVSRIYESDLTIRWVTGASLMVVGLDKPQRIEGIPLDGVVIDEIDECKPSAWDSTIRPALSTRSRPGWAWFIGRPKGRKLLWRLYQMALTDPEWSSFTWKSIDIVGVAEVESARRTLDPRTFKQEYEAAFLTAGGTVYYCFDRDVHVLDVRYDQSLDIVASFDFNVKPGSAVLMQEQGDKTCVIDEIAVMDNSTTEYVCLALIEKLRAMKHQKAVLLYGDPAGNARHTSSQSNDWDQIRAILKNAGFDVRSRVPRSSMPIVDSVNSVNSRMRTADGTVRFAISPRAKYTIRDLEGVSWREDRPDREIDKRDLSLTHWSDAVRYYVHERHPIGGARMSVT